jgi:CMP-N,N'-diacetyllegionaminic acid synthase
MERRSGKVPESVLAVIPARGGSKGLPGKNIREFAGKPLIAHSILCARSSSAVTRTIVSTDSTEIAEIARKFGAEIPFIRPAELALDTTPMIPVLQHALERCEQDAKCRYDSVLLLDPTSPGRFPDDIAAAAKMLRESPQTDAIVCISEPSFNPIWVCVTKDESGHIKKLFPKSAYSRRQDVPQVWRINGTLYLFRRDFLMSTTAEKWLDARLLPLVIPEERAIHIDDIFEFKKWDLLLKEKVLSFPWMNS